MFELGYDKVFHWRDMEPIEVRKGFFRRTLIEGEKLTVVLSEIIPDSSGAPHIHPEEQVMFFLQGRCKDPEGQYMSPEQSRMWPAGRSMEAF
jgi:hypothetical protein